MNYYKNIVSQILKMTSDGFIITDTEGNVREINKQLSLIHILRLQQLYWQVSAVLHPVAVVLHLRC